MNRATIQRRLGWLFAAALWAPSAHGQEPPATDPATLPPPAAPAAPDEGVEPVQPAPAAPSPAPAPAALPMAPPAVAPAPPPYYGYGQAPAAEPEADVPQVPDEDDQPGSGLGSHQSHWMLGAGGRSMLVKSAGFDPFATSDSFAQFSVEAHRTLFVQGNLSLGADLGWDYGSRSSEARGNATQLEVHRIVLGPELRYHVFPRLFGFARLLPGAVLESASLNDALVGSNRVSETWVFGVDATLGGAFEVFGKRNGASRKPRFWVTLEGGYSWAAPNDLNLAEASNSDAAPVRMTGVDLGTLSLAGPLIRAGVALSFDP